jgi:hypothetical protein
MGGLDAHPHRDVIRRVPMRASPEGPTVVPVFYAIADEPFVVLTVPRLTPFPHRVLAWRARGRDAKAQIRPEPGTGADAKTAAASPMRMRQLCHGATPVIDGRSDLAIHP